MLHMYIHIFHLYKFNKNTINTNLENYIILNLYINVTPIFIMNTNNYRINFLKSVMIYLI